MYRYTCIFNFLEVFTREGHHEVSTEKDGLFAFSKGFWINDKLQFTKASDCKYWIPPSQILYVEKQEIARKAGK